MATTYFFSYVDYDLITAQPSCIELGMTISSAAARSSLLIDLGQPTKYKTSGRKKQFEQCASARSQHLPKMF